MADTQHMTDGLAAFAEEVSRRNRLRDAAAARFAAQDKPVQMVGTRDNNHALAGPDLSKPGRYRLTRFLGHEPYGHVEHPDLESAVREAMRDGFVPAELAEAAPELLDSLREMVHMALRNDVPEDEQIARAERAIALLERLGVQA